MHYQLPLLALLGLGSALAVPAPSQVRDIVPVHDSLNADVGENDIATLDKREMFLVQAKMYMFGEAGERDPYTFTGIVKKNEGFIYGTNIGANMHRWEVTAGGHCRILGYNQKTQHSTWSPWRAQGYKNNNLPDDYREITRIECKYCDLGAQRCGY